MTFPKLFLIAAIVIAFANHLAPSPDHMPKHYRDRGPF